MGDFMGGEGLGWRGEREGWMKNQVCTILLVV